MEADVLVVLVTAPAGEVAAGLARSLVEERLAACVNRVPAVSSTYRWEGKVCVEEEDLLIVKTTPGRFAELEERLRTLHPYEVPEILALPVGGGSRSYLDWVRESCE